MVNFPLFSVIVCAWSKTQNLYGRPASVGVAQARPNNIFLYYLNSILHLASYREIHPKVIHNS